MDVVKAFGAVALLLALSACSKDVNNVFQDQSGLNSKTCAGTAIPNRYIVEWEDGRISVEEDQNGDDGFKENFIRPQLEQIKRVEYDRVIRLQSQPLTPADVRETATYDSWGQDMVGAQALWDQNVKGNGVVVGVVDAPVDVSHVQLQPRIAINAGEIAGNGKDDDGNGYVDDVVSVNFSGDDTFVNEHGTHVSGIILADHNAGPMKGMAPEAKLVAAPFLAGPDGEGSLGNAIKALQYVASRGVKVINASWGGAPCNASLASEFRDLEAKGILVVVAAGNSGRDIDVTPEYPAAFGMGNQITVAASTPSDFMASWSNSGFGLVQLAAPGVNIVSTIPGNKYETMDGTSMAAPFVSGAAALLFSLRPQATARDVRQALLETVDVSQFHEFKVSTRGRMNVAKAAQRLLQLVP